MGFFKRKFTEMMDYLQQEEWDEQMEYELFNKKTNKMETTNKLTVRADGFDKNPALELTAKDTQGYQIESAGKALVITQKGNARGMYPFKVIIKSERSGTGMMEIDLDNGRITYTDKNGVVKNVKWE